LRSLLNKCPKCGTYTLAAACPKCGTASVSSHPAKYSPDDKYARYRNPLAYKDESER
jgi:H/ACA ribonucleoprotein complex subunit 3